MAEDPVDATVQKGANFRDLPGVRVRADNKVEFDPDVEREKLPSGKPLEWYDAELEPVASNSMAQLMNIGNDARNVASSRNAVYRGFLWPSLGRNASSSIHHMHAFNNRERCYLIQGVCH
ncbi:unnamed protein product [Fraxinus pennsylvanica]|uniref:Uncharacterized protein n=1 Tax=Fraxinus pennsylvanica TaxID=56036 RepID=A0AAD2A6T7_9LAMI|nr:unnamed protein product [Fraxinus pennsylvanica]